MSEPRPIVVVAGSMFLSALPTVGGPLQTLFDEVTARMRHRVESTAHEIANQVGLEKILARMIEDPRLEPLFAEAMESVGRSSFEAKRRLLGRTVAHAFLDDDNDTVDFAVLIVRALAQLEPVHIRSLLRWERAEGQPNTVLDVLRTTEPVPVLATLVQTGVVQSGEGAYMGAGVDIGRLSPFGHKLLEHLRAVADEELERLADELPPG